MSKKNAPRRQRDIQRQAGPGENEQEDASGIKENVQAEGRSCILIAGYVSRQKFCKRAVARIIEEPRGSHVLVNNAAFQAHTARFEDLTARHFDETLKTNRQGYFYRAQAAVKQMKPGAAVVNTGSVIGLLENESLLDYSVTKGGIHAFTGSLATQLVPRGIRKRCRARPGLDPAQSLGPGIEGHQQIRAGNADEAASGAVGDRAVLGLPGLAAVLKLHQRRNTTHHPR